MIFLFFFLVIWINWFRFNHFHQHPTVNNDSGQPGEQHDEAILEMAPNENGGKIKVNDVWIMVNCQQLTSNFGLIGK